LFAGESPCILEEQYDITEEVEAIKKELVDLIIKHLEQNKIQTVQAQN